MHHISLWCKSCKKKLAIGDGVWGTFALLAALLRQLTKHETWPERKHHDGRALSSFSIDNEEKSTIISIISTFEAPWLFIALEFLCQSFLEHFKPFNFSFSSQAASEAMPCSSVQQARTISEHESSSPP